MWSKVYDWLWNFLSSLGGLISCIVFIPFAVIAMISDMFVPNNPIFRCYDRIVTAISKFILDFFEERGRLTLPLFFFLDAFRWAGV